MIQGKNFGIHISGIRDGHSSNIYSSLDNPKELESLFKDIRTA